MVYYGLLVYYPSWRSKDSKVTRHARLTPGIAPRASRQTNVNVEHDPFMHWMRYLLVPIKMVGFHIYVSYW